MPRLTAEKTQPIPAECRIVAGGKLVFQAHNVSRDVPQLLAGQAVVRHADMVRDQKDLQRRLSYALAVGDDLERRRGALLQGSDARRNIVATGAPVPGQGAAGL